MNVISGLRDRAPRYASLTFERLAASLCLLALVLAASFMPAQSDTWWQLRAGEEIWRTASVSLKDQFSYTVYGGYWPNHEWLSEAFFYAAFRVGGLRLLTAILASLVVLTWVLAWHLTVGPSIRRIPLLAMAIISASPSWSLRPQVLSLFLVVLLVYLLTRRRYAVLPLLFLLWANMHGAVVIGLVILGASLASVIVGERRIPVPLAIATAISVLMTLLTPLGFGLWAEIPQSLGRLREYQVREWQRPQILDPTLLPFWILGFVLVTLLIFRRSWINKSTGSSQPRTIVFAAVALLPLAVGSSRNVPPFVLLAVPAIAILLEDLQLFPESSRAFRQERPTLNWIVLGSASLATVASIALAWTFEARRLNWQPLAPDLITALDSCPEHIYNRYDEGGYLIWFLPTRKVFIDSRQDPYPSALVREHLHTEMSGDYTSLFARHNVHCAFVATNSVLARRLSDAHWVPLYRGPAWVVLAGP